jgi:uncharacterized protein (TIGR00251 family)
MLLKIKVTPNSSKNKIVGWLNDVLKIRIAAPPQKGKANKELVEFLSEEFKIPKSSIEIKKGYKERNKIIEINSLPKLPAKQEKLC